MDRGVRLMRLAKARCSMMYLRRTPPFRGFEAARPHGFHSIVTELPSSPPVTMIF